MQKRGSFSFARSGGWPSAHRMHQESGCSLLPIVAAMKRSGGTSSRPWLILFVFVALNSIWILNVGAAPVVSSHSGNGAASRTSLSRCPAMFNPVSMVFTNNVSVVNSTAKFDHSKAAESSLSQSCRYFLNHRFGTLTTPGFPSAFPVPFICSWIIDATGFEPDSFVTLYLTQMYLTRGVKAVQYSFRNETHAVGRKELDDLHAYRPRPYSVYRIKARYLEVQVNLDDLINANLRVDRRLMDVYGFNITYEIQPNGSRIRSDTCNVANCTFNGHCFASHNYSQFQCSCLPNFSGKYCQHGPECNPEKGINVCKNGGICGYRIGLSVVRCSCPPSYNGSRCEFHREFVPGKECISRVRLNCSHRCVFTDKGIATCRCPQNQALRSDNSTCYPLGYVAKQIFDAGQLYIRVHIRVLCFLPVTSDILYLTASVPLRILGQLELDRPDSFNDTRLVEGITAALRKMADEFTAFKLAVGSVNLFEPNSNKFQFILWNSEKYDMSWTNVPAFRGPSIDARNNGSFAAILNQSFSGLGVPLNSDKQKMSRDHQAYASLQWNNSYTSFVHQINLRTWKIQGEKLAVRNISIVQVPALIIEWVKLDVKGQVREGYPFTVACNANGSGKKDLKLVWYKDGHPIDDSFALVRNISIFIHRKRDLRGFFTLYLEVKQASIFDRGEFECRAKDWGQTARKSIFLDVITPPILDLMPINPVVFAGTAVNLICRDENHLARRTSTKYVWLKNGHPIDSSCEETIEDLTPVGSLLKIASIQLSTSYTCQGENGTKMANKMTQIFVTERACPQEKSQGIEWPRTAVDMTNFQFCPAGYVGVAKRHCFSMKELPGDDRGKISALQPYWGWEEPDFSNCSDRELAEIYRELKLITLGYVVTDVASIFDNFADLIQGKLKGITEFNPIANWKKTTDEETPSPYLPGEGNALLDVAMSLEAFLWRRTEVLPHSFWNTTAVRYLYALDALLSLPQDIFRLDGGLLILRFIQNHLTLLGVCPQGEYSLNAIQSRLLKNGDISTHGDKKQFRYTGLLPALPSQTGFKSLRQLAPAQFFFNKPSRSKISMDIYSVEQLQARGGEYLCALLLFQPTNHSRGWDIDSCSVERLSDPSAFRCHCTHQGTVVLLYAIRDMEAKDMTIVLWKLIYFAASASHLIIIGGLMTSSVIWYQRRSMWIWFQIQVEVSVIPPSLVYFLRTNFVVSNPFLTILLTAAVYLNIATVSAMIMYLKTNAIQCTVERMSEGKLSQNNLRLVMLSLVVPLTLSGVHTLIEKSLAGMPFISWFSQLTSFSGIFFFLVYCTLLVSLLSIYATLARKLSSSPEKSNSFATDALHTMGHNFYCPILAVLGLVITGSTLCRFHWLSLGAHCITASLHLLAVLLTVTLTLNFGGTNNVGHTWCCWRQSKLPEADKVSELLNTTAMVESPQQKCLLLAEQHPTEGLETSDLARRTNRGYLHDTPFSMPSRIRRLYRSIPASPSFLQRAGLGPDVVRAFSSEEESSHQLLGNASTGHEGDIPPAKVKNGPGGQSGRDRKNSIPKLEEMKPDDLDSGIGPSGGGESQKLNGFDNFSGAWKLLRRIRHRLKKFGFHSGESTSGEGSFRSRQSTTSSITTAEISGEQDSSTATTEGMENTVREIKHLELMTPSRLRRFRPRWSEDYGKENEMSFGEISHFMAKRKPFRARCFISCSSEKIGSNALASQRFQGVETADRKLESLQARKECCNCYLRVPKITLCEFCLEHSAENRPGTVLVHAVIESHPKLTNKDVCQYLEMDPAGSLAIDQQRVKRLQVYYNMVVKTSSHTIKSGDFNRISRIRPLGSLKKDLFASPSLLRQKKIFGGRIGRKKRRSFRKIHIPFDKERSLEIVSPSNLANVVGEFSSYGANALNFT